MDRQEEIRRLAYDLYEKSGRIPGREVENWLEAERIVMSRSRRGGSAQGASGVKRTKAGKPGEPSSGKAITPKSEKAEPLESARSETKKAAKTGSKKAVSRAKK